MKPVNDDQITHDTDSPIVWLLQATASEGVERDLSSCRGYGRLRTVLQPHEQPSKDPQAVLQRLREVLMEACDDDYFVFAGGDPMTPFCAAYVLAELGLTQVVWLRWDRRTDHHGNRLKDGYYTPVKTLLLSPERQSDDNDHPKTKEDPHDPCKNF